MLWHGDADWVLLEGVQLGLVGLGGLLDNGNVDDAGVLVSVWVLNRDAEFCMK